MVENGGGEEIYLEYENGLMYNRGVFPLLLIFPKETRV